MSVKSASARRRIFLLSALLLLLAVAVVNRNLLAWLPHYQAGRRLAARRFDDARWWLNVAQGIAGRNPQTAFYRSRLARKTGDFQQASAQLELADRWGMPDDRVELEKILIRAQAGKTQLARTQIGELLRGFHSEAPEIYEALVSGCMSTRTSMRTAIDLLNSWAAEYPDATRPHMLLADLSIEILDTENAINELRLVLDIDPAHGPAALALGELMFKQQEYDQAMQLFETAQRSPATRHSAVVWQAACLRTFGRVDEAGTVLAKALREDPNSSRANLEQAQLDIARGRVEPAIERLRSVLILRPQLVEAQFALASALRSQGRLDEANELRAAASEASTALIRAKHLVRDLVLDPDNVELRSEIGQIHFRYGDPQDARAWLRSALMLDPNHQPAKQLLADLEDSR